AERPGRQPLDPRLPGEGAGRDLVGGGSQGGEPGGGEEGGAGAGRPQPVRAVGVPRQTAARRRRPAGAGALGADRGEGRDRPGPPTGTPARPTRRPSSRRSTRRSTR